MSWHERMNRAVDYIEKNLSGNIDMEYISRMTYQSVTSFQRTFSITTEMSVSEYIRRRRMSLAAYELQNSEAKVMDISLKYGYDSPEAFTRAFKERYGVSPSMARKEGIPLKAFPRISFLQTIKGDVVMDYRTESSAVRITNLYCEHLPALRLIGKRYTSADLDADMRFGSKWSEWFQNGWFGLLGSIGCLPGHEGTAVFAVHISNEMAYWIGMFFPEGTPVPEGFDYTDIPAGDVGMCWVYGYRDTGELFAQSAHDLCLAKIRQAGYAVKVDFDGVPCKWSFERYHNDRFFVPDDEGKVILDYGIYVIEREGNAGRPSNVDRSERLNRHSDYAALPNGERISGVAPYTVEIENNLFLCAMTTLFLKLKKFDENTPFFCSNKERYCDNCEECGDGKKSNLARHHLDLYHYLLTVTGVGLMWGDPNQAGEYDLKYVEGITPPHAEDRLDFAMKAEGFTYVRMDKTKGEREIFRQIMESVRRDMPVLMKLEPGPGWCIVTGFDGETGAIYGLDAKNHINYYPTEKRSYTEDGHFVIADWYKNLRKAIMVTGEAGQAIDFNGLLRRMIGRLLMPERTVLEAMIPRMIDAITVDNARGAADYMNHLVGYAAEARWHGAECFGSFLLRKTDDEAVKSRLRKCAELFFDTHDTCWQIWGQLGIGPHTNFKLPNLSGQMMLERERQAKLKQFFARIFNNDRLVLEILQSLADS